MSTDAAGNDTVTLPIFFRRAVFCPESAMLQGYRQGNKTPLVSRPSVWERQRLTKIASNTTHKFDGLRYGEVIKDRQAEANATRSFVAFWNRFAIMGRLSGAAGRRSLREQSNNGRNPMPEHVHTLRIVATAFFLFLWNGSSTWADSFGTREEAQAMVERAAAFLKSNGREVALAEFGNPKGQFIDRDLYLVTYDATNGVRLSHPINPKLVGKSTIDMRDLDGKAYGQEIMTTANAVGSGWVDFKFSDPITKKLGDKSLYVLKVGDIIIGCGVYKH